MRTTAGRTWMALIMGDGTDGDAGTGDMAPADYLALTANAAAPAAGDTALTGEIVADGLERAQAVFAHTPGTDTYTLTKSFNYSGAGVTVNKVGVFNAAAAGTMPFVDLITPAVLAGGDIVNVTYVVEL